MCGIAGILGREGDVVHEGVLRLMLVDLLSVL